MIVVVENMKVKGVGGWVGRMGGEGGLEGWVESVC